MREWPTVGGRRGSVGSSQASGAVTCGETLASDPAPHGWCRVGWLLFTLLGIACGESHNDPVSDSGAAPLGATHRGRMDAETVRAGAIIGSAARSEARDVAHALTIPSPSPPGIRHMRLVVGDTRAFVEVYVADLARVGLVAVDARIDGRIVATVDLLRQEVDAYVAVNGTFFDGQQRPLGLLISGGVELSRLRDADWGVVYVQRGVVDLVHTRDFRPSPSIDFAVQCGPRVVIDGKPPRLKTQVARRTGICILGPRRVALFVVDTPIEANALAAWLATSEDRDGLGCTDALLLDGGPSTQLDDRTQLHPTVPGGWPVPNAVALVLRATDPSR